MADLKSEADATCLMEILVIKGQEPIMTEDLFGLTSSVLYILQKEKNRNPCFTVPRWRGKCVAQLY